MPIPKPIPVLIEVSRFLTTETMASRCSDLIRPCSTSKSISSSMASQRSVALSSVTTCSLVRKSASSIMYAQPGIPVRFSYLFYPLQTSANFIAKLTTNAQTAATQK